MTVLIESTAQHAPSVLQVINPAECNVQAFEFGVATAAKRWQRAYKKVKVLLVVARAFGTLRDQHCLNEIKPSQLKTLSKLGRDSASVLIIAAMTVQSVPQS
eukprot:gene27313-4617_t